MMHRRCLELCGLIQLLVVSLASKFVLGYPVACLQKRKSKCVLRADSSEFLTIASDTLNVLCETFKIVPTATLRNVTAFNHNLRDTINDTDLKEWSRSMGLTTKKSQLNIQHMLERHPTLMARALMSDSLQTTTSLLRRRADMTDLQVKKVLAKHESIPPRHRTRKLLNTFESKVQLSPHQIHIILLSQPKLLRYRPERLDSVIQCLLPLVGLEGVQKIILRWPIVLTYSVQHRIQPGVAFLQSLGDSRWERVLIQYPQVLTHSVSDSLIPRLEYLETTLLDIPSAKQLVTHYPPLLWLSQDLLESKFEYLQYALDLTKQETEILIETYPQVLGLSIDRNLVPTIAFLKTKLSTEQLRDFCLYQPALLAYSLTQRLQPRMLQMEAHNISVAYAPAYLMSLTDTKFQQWLGQQSLSWSLR